MLEFMVQFKSWYKQACSTYKALKPPGGACLLSRGGGISVSVYYRIAILLKY